MNEKKLKTIHTTATIALFLLLVLSFGFLWGEFKVASGLVEYADEESAKEVEAPAYLTGETKAGKNLFQSKCARCHMVDRKLTGPALMNVKDRWTDSTNLYAWIKNSQAFLATGDNYASSLHREFNSIMPAFPELTDADIREILFYVDPDVQKAN